MRIAEIDLVQFRYELPDVGVSTGDLRYEPGRTFEPPGFVLTLRTADGTEGHYRASLFPAGMVPQVQMAVGSLLGRDPLEREAIWADLWRGHRHLDHLGLGAIDVALWDLAGRHYGASVSELLGGFRDRMPAYASTYSGDDAEDGLSSAEAYADFALECRDAGYPAFKIHAFGEPERDVDVCRAVAEAVGDEMDLMLDPGGAYETYARGLQVGRVLDELGFFWYEDPLADTGHSQHATGKLVEALETPVLGAENVRGGPYVRADHVTSGALDLVRADCHLDGGITGVTKIATMAESLGVDVELHAGGPSTLQCLGAIRNTNYFERALVHPQVEYKTPQGFRDYDEAIDGDGRVAIPDGPGLGVEIDWDWVEARETDRRQYAA